MLEKRLKKTYYLILLLLLCLLPVSVQAERADAENGAAPSDAVKTLRFSIWLELPNAVQERLADVNRDGIVNVTDTVMIARRLAGYSA